MKALHDLIKQSLRGFNDRGNSISDTVDYMYLDNPVLKLFHEDHYRNVSNFVNVASTIHLTMSVTLEGSAVVIEIERNHTHRLTITCQYEQGELTMVPTHLRVPKIVNGNCETMVSVAIALTSPGLISTVKLTELGVKHVN